MARIEFTDPSGQVQKRALPESPTGVIMGRSSSCHIVLPSNAIGRNHGKILFHGGRYHYEDLGSVNGSFVNDKKIAGRVPLADGDQIRLGDIIIRFSMEGAPAPKAVAPKPVGRPGATDEVASGTRATSAVVVPEPIRSTTGQTPVASRQAATAMPRKPAPEPEPVSAVRRPSPSPVPGSVPSRQPGSGMDPLTIAELERLKKENAALRADARAASARSGKPSEEMAKLTQDLQDARSALADREDEVRHLRGIAQDAERRCKDAENRSATANSSLDSIHSKYMDMREQVSHLQGQLEQVRAESGDKDAEIAELREKASALAAQLDSIRSRGNQASDEIANLKLKLTEKDREGERLKREIDLREYDLKALREENERLQEYCETDTGRQGELERKVKNLEAVIEENRNYIAELRRNLETRDREVREIRLGVGIVDLEQEKQRLLDDYHKKSREVDSLRSNLASVTADLSGVNQEKEDLVARLKAAEESAKTRKAEREDISDHPDFRAKLREAESLNEQLSTLSRENETLKAAQSEFPPEERARLQAEAVGGQEKVRVLQGRLEALQAELSSCQRAAAEVPVVGAAPAPAAVSEEASDLLSRVSEAAEALGDDMAVMQVSLRDVRKFFEALQRANLTLPPETLDALGTGNLAESIDGIRDLERMMAGDLDTLKSVCGEGQTLLTK